jgi:hypothetical protein
MRETSAGNLTLSLKIDPDVLETIARELGTVNKFYDRFGDHLASETAHAAQLVRSPQALSSEDKSKGGPVEIVVATTALVQAVAPIVIAYFRNRYSCDVSITKSKRKDGSVARTVRVRRGSSR